MADYSTLKAAIADYVKDRTGLDTIDGDGLQETLLAMVNSLGANYQFAGVAKLTPTQTDPGMPDQNVFYIAAEPGTYTNFPISGGYLQVAENEVAIFKYDGAWSKDSTGAASVEMVNQLGQYVDNPEWVKVVTDSEDKILYGVKTDGKFYFGDGCPPQIREYVTEHLAEITAELNNKVDKIPGKSLIDSEFASSQEVVKNPEYLKVITDADGKIIEAIRLDGVKVQFADVAYPNGIPRDIIKYLRGGRKLKNPYSDVDFATCIKVLSNTHEHIFEQERLEWCYNKGIRNINLLHYQPAAPQKFVDGYSVDFQDYTSINDLTIITKHSGDYLPTSPYHDFTDKDGNAVNLSDIVVLPNCEHTNIRGYNYWVHANFLGSEFAEPADLPMPGGAYGDREHYKILDDEQLFQGVLAHRPFGKTFGTLNHPADSRTNIEDEERFVARSNGLINSVEVFNGDYGGIDAEVNKNCEAFYDRMLLKGYKLWCVSVPDWANVGATFDPGMNMLLLPADYESLSYVEKQNAALDAYISGRYYAIGVGGVIITNVQQNGDIVTFTFNKAASTIYGIFDGVSRIIGQNVSQVTVDASAVLTYFRLKAVDSNGDFIYSNPMFVE